MHLNSNGETRLMGKIREAGNLNSPTSFITDATGTVLIENTTALPSRGIGLGSTYVRTAVGANPNKLILKSAANNAGIDGAVGDNSQTLSSLIINTPNTVNLRGTSVTTTVSQDYTGDDITISSDGDFDFAAAIDDLQSYDVSIENQPTRSRRVS